MARQELIDARVPKALHEETKMTILTRLQRTREYWEPLHQRQDLWSMMYFLQDVQQQMKPVGHRRFISNEPHTAVDLAMSILTRNDAFWRIALYESASENSEERSLIGKIERSLQGIIYDIDEQFSMRLKMRFWKQVAASALLRGFIWGKVHVTTEALKYRSTPLIAEIYDPRLVHAHTDAMGLNYVCIETMTTLGDLVNMYPDKFEMIERQVNYDPNRPAIKVEYWSNDRGEKKGINAVIASEVASADSTLWAPGQQAAVGFNDFVVEPYYHGYTPESLPVVGVPVNGLNLVAKPQLGQLITDRLAERMAITGVPNAYAWWNGQNSHVAEMGRSILAAVEEHIPQYNELVATIMQHLGLSTYGNWVFTSPTGEKPKFKPGIESVTALTPEEKLERIQIGAINSDAYRLVELLGDEKQNGMLANILRATQPQAGMNGVLFQQMANAALNALEPYQDGMEEFGQRIGTSLLMQLKQAGPALKPFEILSRHSAGSSKTQSYWVMEFDPKKDLAKQKRFRPRPVFKPALPDDLAVRINAARLALDPRRPILSLTTVLEHILQVEDPTDEIDRIWEDIANNDPVLVLEQISAALERLGETDLAQRIQEKQFRTAMIEELTFRQQTGADIPPPQINPQTGALENMPSDAGAGQFNTQRPNVGGGGADMGGAPQGMPTGDQMTV